MLETLRPTSDSWYGNYPDSMCKLHLVHRTEDAYPESFAVIVTGNDDFGYEKEFMFYYEALAVYNELNSLEEINHVDCKERGFEYY